MGEGVPLRCRRSPLLFTVHRPPSTAHGQQTSDLRPPSSVSSPSPLPVSATPEKPFQVYKSARRCTEVYFLRSLITVHW
jgi:hypothetical protein